MTRSTADVTVGDVASASPEGVRADSVVGLPTQLRSPRTKLVYLWLDTVSEAELHELRADLGMDLLTLYPVLKTLTTLGLVEREGGTYRCRCRS